MKTVELAVTGGHTTLVDEDIAERLRGKKLWLAGGDGYVHLWHNGREIPLHRFVMGEPEGMQVDHKLGDLLDNRRSQLRVCTASENNANSRTPARGRSGYRLVYKRSDRAGYECRCVGRSGRYIADLRSRHVAALFADQVLVDCVGPFVLRNFPKAVGRRELRGFLESTSGRIFRAVFSRRSDGRQREMLCRTGVRRGQKGRSMPFDPRTRDLFGVYDVTKRAYRFIPLENVICIRYKQTNYRVLHGPSSGPKAA